MTAWNISIPIRERIKRNLQKTHKTAATGLDMIVQVVDPYAYETDRHKQHHHNDRRFRVNNIDHDESILPGIRRCPSRHAWQTNIQRWEHCGVQIKHGIASKSHVVGDTHPMRKYRPNETWCIERNASTLANKWKHCMVHSEITTSTYRTSFSSVAHKSPRNGTEHT